MTATGWYIAGGIILLIILLLAIPVVIRFEYGETLYLRVRYLFITLYRIPAKPKKPKKRKKQKKQQKQGETSDEAAAQADAQAQEKSGAAEEKPKKKKEKKEKDPRIPTLKEIFELVRTFFDSLGRPLKKLCRRIKICDFELYMICGGDDAAKAALTFGAVNLAVGNALGHLSSWFTVKDPHIDINVDFQSEQTTTECCCTVRLSALVVLIFAFNFLGRLIWRVLRNSVVMDYIRRLTGKSGKKQKKAKSSRKGK